MRLEASLRLGFLQSSESFVSVLQALEVCWVYSGDEYLMGWQKQLFLNTVLWR